MKVCIMCGGEGTRLRPLTFERPKPCIPIMNMPSILHLVSHLSNLGFHEMVITLGYMAKAIEDILGDGSFLGTHISYVREKEKLGTAGSVKNAQKYLEDRNFLVVGGDHVTDINLLEFYREHQSSGAITTIGLISIDDPSEYGIAEIDVTNRIQRFREKPSPGEIFSNLASTGMYVCEPEIFDFISPRAKFDFARDLFPMLMEQDRRLNGWLARGNWTDVGSPRSLRQAEHWKLHELGITTISGEIHLSSGARISGPVQVKGSLTLGKHSRIIGPVSVGAGTTMGEDVLVGPYTSIGEECVIQDGTKIFSSSLYNRVRIGRSSTVSGSIVDNDTVIGEDCSIENDTVLGPRIVMGDRVVIHSGTRIWPEVEIPTGTAVIEHLLNEDYDVNRQGS
jgi:mannose-1-phosphate guanylyltransferase